MRNRIKYSQNFLANNKLVESLVEHSDISPSDTVIEIGAGNGIITSELLKKAKTVIAYELDPNLFKKLQGRFQNEAALELRYQDFLLSQLPNYPYKILSNIPFSITSAVIKKLTLGDNPPEVTYLILQKEAAMKFAGRPLDITNSQLAVILHPWFEFSIVYDFKPTDFFPRPNVDVVLLEIKKRTNPLITNQTVYRDFVTFTFNQPRKSILNKNLRPSELDFKDWISLFKSFLALPKEKQKIANGAFSKQQRDQEGIEKIHRTRVDQNWREF